jgi:UDP-N-acetylglucosamine transferase subunit ALG13
MNGTIFATVGAQMGFDRLIRAVDEWAAAHPETPVFAQIGPGDYEPTAMEWTRLLEPAGFRDRVENAGAIVGHAGMGTIITALQHAKPVLIMPRRGDLQETRNDHQVATAERFGTKQGVLVALHEGDIARMLDTIRSADRPDPLGNTASAQLVETIRRFIHSADPVVQNPRPPRGTVR